MNIMNVDYSTKIPNNVNLSEDRQVLKALEGWHPGYIDWWNDMGPDGFQQSLVYLRTAYSVDPRGWAKFDYVKMPDYRWGILLAPDGVAELDLPAPQRGRRERRAAPLRQRPEGAVRYDAGVSFVSRALRGMLVTRCRTGTHTVPE